MVSKHSIYLLLVMTLVAATACKRPAPADRETGIIPLPVSLEMGTGSFRMGDGTKLISSTPGSGLDKIAEMFRDEIASLGGPELETGSGRPRKNSIALELSDEAFASPEGYHLSVKPSGILITASAPQGIFYGLKSLEQMILVRDAEENGMRLPCLEIEDYPRYSWRGMHLDVSRHFFTVDSVKRYIDFMALYKYNRFHWHLTDDQGWRIEIREYPDLTRTGAWRVPAEEGSAATVTPSTGGLYGGFYTQAEIREVVQYAADRFIEVVPEIEMPGHSQAAIAAYPELGVTGKRLEVKRHWGISPNIFNPFEGTFVFLENVLTEVMDLFPYGYIHIGGDEAIKDQWEASAKVQAFIASHGLADEDELQSWFLKKIDTFLVANGRKLIGWDEILDGGLPPEATVMSWRPGPIDVVIVALVM